MTDYVVPENEAEDWEGFSGSQTDIEDQSLHPATLVALTRKMLPSAFDASGKAPAIIWTFALEDLEGTTVDGTSSEATGPKSKARPWLEALLGKAQTTSLLRGRIDKGALIGRQCLVLIAINDNGYPKVANVLPTQGARRTPAEPQPTPDTTSAPVAAPGPSDAPTDDVTALRCSTFEPALGRCVRPTDHAGQHRSAGGESWT